MLNEITINTKNEIREIKKYRKYKSTRWWNKGEGEIRRKKIARNTYKQQQVEAGMKLNGK